MKIDHFDPPGGIDDFGGDAALKDRWSRTMSDMFDTGVASVTGFLQAHGGGTCQFYNPVTHGRPDPDLPAAAGDITWNGFPKRFSATGPGHPTRFADAEPAGTAGRNRPQDEYLEWHVTRNGAGQIVSVQFTCEGYDYYEFLARNAPATLLGLYRTFISPAVQPGDLMSGGGYDVTNVWNTERGAMHLTHPANNLFAEVFLAASATVRRQQHGAELTQSIPLIRCAQYGDDARNSDPNIGAAVNGLAREGRMVTLANPVGLYMASFDGSGLTLDGQPAGGFFKVVRGAFPRALRAVYELPPDLAAAGKTVSDVTAGGQPVAFGGQLAQRVTMHLVGAASVAQGVNNAPAVCGPVRQVAPAAPAAAHALAAAPRPPSGRGAERWPPPTARPPPGGP
ncbi:MAG TPA: hypothetical protein VH092_21120 [Urbifossiella sp.]|nr:hypothetical protein [Urbifossiella sp.]